MKSSRTLLSNQSGRDVGSTSLDRWLGYGQMEYRVANMRWIFRPSTVFETSVAVARKCCVLLSADDDG